MRRMFTIKKIICIVLCTVVLSQLVGCYQDLEKHSLHDYIEQINKNGVGFSSVEIDRPDHFLPSLTFIEDYQYIDGSFHWREDDPFRGVFTSKVHPEVSMLCLRYDVETYYQAKEYMLEAITPYGDEFYIYNDYVFYENSNFIELRGRQFPEFFTMACYNDEKNTLVFIGMYSGTLAGPSCLDDRFLSDIKENWADFIETYYTDLCKS